MGLDAGTTGVKSIIFTLDGGIASSAYKEYMMRRPKPNYAVFDSNEFWAGSVYVLRQSIQQGDIDPEEIAAIGVTGIGGALVPVDKNGKCLNSILAQYDRRAEETRKKYEKEDAMKRELKRVGRRGLSGVSSKILWFKENRPEVYRKTSKFLGGPEYVLMRLTGEMEIDYSMGSIFGLINPIKKEWDDRLIDALGLGGEKLPDLHPSGTVVGEIGSEVSKATGLNEGTPIALGGYDVMCGSLGVGAIREGVIMDVTGTVEQVAADVPSDFLKRIGPEHRIFFGCHVARGKYFATGGVGTAGSLFRWYRDTFGREEMREAEEKDLDVYDILTGEASEAEIGSRRLLVLPYFHGQGAIVGLQLAHGRREVIRAILEGITFGIRRYIEDHFESTGIKVSELRAVGGGAKSDLWLQIKANVINKRIVVPSVTEATALGAAIMAGIGVGIYKDEEEAVERTYREKKEVLPETSAVKEYEKHYKAYRDLENTLRPFYDRLTLINGP